MKVTLINPRGFCAGVDMAIETVRRALCLYGPPVYVFHEIVHNRFVVQELRNRGAIFVDEINAIPIGATVVFSAHGVSPAVRREAARRQHQVIDATCPLVAKVHSEVRAFAKQGYTIVLIGHADHDEMVGTFGEAPEAIRIVSSIEDVDALQIPQDARLAYLTQTTLSVDDTAAIVETLRGRFPQLVGPTTDDICYATQNRQNGVKRVAGEADIVLIVGSPNSSNSNRLCDVARALGTPAYLIDDESDLDAGWFRGDEHVVISAGASAPEVAVRRVVKRLRDDFSATVADLPPRPERDSFPLPKEVRELPRSAILAN